MPFTGLADENSFSSTKTYPRRLTTVEIKQFSVRRLISEVLTNLESVRTRFRTWFKTSASICLRLRREAPVVLNDFAKSKILHIVKTFFEFHFSIRFCLFLTKKLKKRKTRFNCQN